MGTELGKRNRPTDPVDPIRESASRLRRISKLAALPSVLSKSKNKISVLSISDNFRSLIQSLVCTNTEIEE